MDTDRPLTAALGHLYALTPLGWRVLSIVLVLALLTWALTGSRGMTNWLIGRAVWIIGGLLVVRVLAGVLLP